MLGNDLFVHVIREYSSLMPNLMGILEIALIKMAIDG
jgi:hypothetical protein